MAGDRIEAGGGDGLRLATLNLALRLIAKPRLAWVKEPEAARRDLLRAARLLARPPHFALYLPEVIEGPGGALKALHVSTGPVDRRRVILYLHGGAFVTGSPATHRAMMARLSEAAGVPVFAPDYRLAPEHAFPAALEDAQAAWDHLYEAGYDPEDIAIGGDSSGGGLAFALLSRLCHQGRAPAAAFGFSPLVDLSGTSPSVRANGRSDPLLPAGRFDEVVDMYLQGHSAGDPEASPVFADYPGAPPVLLQHSDTEILRDDTIRLAHRLRSFGAEVTVQDWPRAPHVWQFFGWLPEARVALEDAGQFVRAALRPEAGPPAGS
jgi:acetyl esterase/lipase